MRAICVAACLLLCASWQVRAGSHGASFSAKDDGHGGVLLTPMLPVTVRAEQIRGPRQINKSEILTNCKQGNDVQKVFQNGQEGTVTQFKLTCGDRVFILQAIHFEE